VKRVFARILAAAVLLAAGIAAYELWPQRLPPKDAPTVELVKFCTTDQFGNLSDEKKMPYVKELLDRGYLALALAANEAKLTEEERERGIDNAMQAAINVRLGEQLDTWLKLDEAGKKAYVKKLVQQMPPRQGPGPGPGGRMAPPGSRGMTPARVKKFVENTTPARRAAMPEFMAAVRKEREKPQ
jgi:hypothetical protein